MKILFVAPEVVPFAKTGGLADVAGALPKALKVLGHDVRIILPRYRAVDPKKFGLTKTVERLAVTVGAKTVEAAVFEGQVPHASIPVYCIDQPVFFDRDGLYQDKGADFPDNLERFSFFSQATLKAIPQLGWQPEIVHCHDWQTALVCAHLALTHAADRFWSGAATILTVHNLAYQGLFSPEAFALTNLPARAFGIEGLEFYGNVNCLKGGLVYADGLSTVSPTYAKEIQLAESGCGLEGLLAARREDLVGILNGIDPEEWNPKTDPLLPAHYGVEELAGKSLCKLSLQRQQNLPQHHVLLIGMIQRLAEQKGIDILVEAAEELLRLQVQLVILGTGDPVYHDKLTALAKRFSERLSVNLRFDNALAHQIEAGCDAFLMPSRFEPCGLNQMYSMRYGAVPIVRRVGGLADTVVDVSPATLEAGTATGFVFDDYSANALLEAVKRAAAAFGHHELWTRLIRGGMQQDFSWGRSAREYVSVYERALDQKIARRQRVQADGRHPHAQPVP
jgi:starch synthase